MKILIDIGHPAHVHLFKHFIRVMKERGHEILVSTRNKEMTTKLLDIYGFNYVSVGKRQKNVILKLIELIRIDFRLLLIARGFLPDIFLSHGSMYAAHVSAILNVPHISLEDTEHSTEQICLYQPFTDVILTSFAFNSDLGKKQIRYNGYHELAYLHPKYFKPDPSILDILGVESDERFVILRFVSWDASHDIGHSGMSYDQKIMVVREFSKIVKVFISSEVELEKEIEKYRIDIPVDRIHDALHYAALYVGEGATMASECAVLGTPAIYVNSLRLGYIDEEEDTYGLVFQSLDTSDIVKSGLELLTDPKMKGTWSEKRHRLLSEKIDVTGYFVDLIEKYNTEDIGPAPC